MCSNLGSNIAGSVLAGIATIFCFIAFWFYMRAAKTREKSNYAVHIGIGEGEESVVSQGCEYQINGSSPLC